jgi:hypothetical protein
MNLLLRRTHRSGLLSKVVYTLDVRAHLSEAERAAVSEYGLARVRLYRRMEVADPGKGLLGIAFRFAFKAGNLSLHARDLVDGKRLECADIVEILSVEDQVRASARTFSQLLAAAVGFDGEEVVEF